jgi:hypothetical protein
MVISIDLPAFTMGVLHENGHSFEVYKDENGHIGLRHANSKVNVNAMLTTGGGTKTVGVVQPQNVIEFAPTTLSIKTRQDERGKSFAHHAIFSFWVYREGEGMRPAGDGSLDAVAFVKKIVEDSVFEMQAQLYVASPESDTTTVNLRLESKATIAEKRDLARWLHGDSDAIRMLTQRMVSRPDLAAKLTTFAINRFQRTSDRLNGLYGGLNNKLALPEMDTRRDTLGSTSKVDPTQLDYLLKRYNLDREMARKSSVGIARNAVLAMAELCAFESPMDANGEHKVSIHELMQFARDAPMKQELKVKYIELLENCFTGFDAANRNYVNDEEFEFVGDELRPSANVGEKMDLALGRSSLTFATLRRRFEENATEIDGVLADLRKLGPTSASNKTLVCLKTEQLSMLMGKRHSIRRGFLNSDGDCEDGAFATVMSMKLLQEYPDMITGHIKKFVGKSFLSVHMAFRDPAVNDFPELEAQLQNLVEGCVRFASDALRWQSKSVPGKTIEYEPAFGFASAPSCPAKTDPGAVAKQQFTLSRETCDSHDDWINRILEGRQLGGHCYAVRVLSTPARNKDGLWTQLKEVDIDGVLESTVTNFRKRVCTHPQDLADKTVEVAVSGVKGRLCRVPHARARVAIGEAATNSLAKKLAAELMIAQPQDLAMLGRNFYNVFAHIGASQFVSAEFAEGLVTKTIDARSAEVQIHKNCPANVSFSASTLAWDASPTSTKTTSVALSAPLAEHEKMMLDAIVEETAPVHVMTQDELSYAMEKTGHFVNLGFVGGEFVGTDYTGGRLDSDKKIALHLVIRLSEVGAGLPEYWNSAAGARAVVESKLKEVLPDARVRVKEIETGLFSAQVVVDAEK